MINLHILFRYILVITISITFSACSINPPGVPGLKTSSSRYAKPQKEGVDYKLIVIDAQAIQNQKPFDYINYINERKKRSNAYALLTSSSTVSNSELNSNSINSTSFSVVSANDRRSSYQYIIGKSDVLNITVWDHPELTTPIEGTGFSGHVVGNDGKFYFPYSGKIQALGKTAEQVRNELQNKLASFITKPQVSVSVANFRSQKVYISGAIMKPSTINVNDVPLTVRDAISLGGGVTPNLYTGVASLARGNQKISIDLNRMLKHNDNRQNFMLKNGDRLHIIERGEFVRDIERERAIGRVKKELERELKSESAKVFVMGEILKPGSVEYRIEDGMTLAEAINDAGSFKEDTVNPKGVFVVRKETAADTIPTVYQLPLASVQSMFFAEQFNVRPRDIVYVTAAPSIRWNRILNSLLPSLTLYRLTTTL